MHLDKFIRLFLQHAHEIARLLLLQLLCFKNIMIVRPAERWVGVADSSRLEEHGREWWPLNLGHSLPGSHPASSNRPGRGPG